MNFTVLNWNIGGAKVLEQKKERDRDSVRDQINDDLIAILKDQSPDAVTLQEVVAYKQPIDNELVNIIKLKELENIGYKSFFFPLIDSLGFSSQDKWDKIKKESDWDDNTYFAQGNGMLFRTDAPLFPFWDLSRADQTSPGKRVSMLSKQQEINPVEAVTMAFDHGYQKNLIEHVHLEEGVYLGDRNTEPRAALVAHLILNSPSPQDQKPIDVFVINVHLVTIMKERVGIPSKDAEATHQRLAQLGIIFDGIISKYNSWFDDSFPARGMERKPAEWETFDRHQPIWLLCGDFNFTENSEEYDFIMRRNFIDTTLPDRRIGTSLNKKGKTLHHSGTKTSGTGNPATLTLDYIFAGPKFVALSPLFSEAGMGQNTVAHEVVSSDHYPIISRLPLYLIT